MNEAYVSYKVENKIGTIEFYTPQHNSLPSTILTQLAQTIKLASEDENSTVLVLKSGGDKTFCAGASFDELLQIENEEQGLIFFSGFAHVINAIRKSSKFIIGSVQGKTIGGGVGLACACDYTLATNKAQIKLSELAVGIGPFVVGPAVERKIGFSAAYELAIDATNFKSPNWAKEKGLFVEIYENIEELNVAVLEVATTLSSQSSIAMKEIKKAFWHGTENWDTFLIERARISGSLVLTDFTKKFLHDFKSKNSK